MYVWWAVLFGLGWLAFLDSYYNFGTLFRQLNAALLQLVCLGLFARIVLKTRAQTKEKLAERITQLEEALRNSKNAEAESAGPDAAKSEPLVEA